MIKVLFFGSYREQLQCKTLSLSEGEYPKMLFSLREKLSEKGTDWQKVMDSKRTIVAVNKVMMRADYCLQENDEVAFFPPVTGG